MENEVKKEEIKMENEEKKEEIKMENEVKKEEVQVVDAEVKSEKKEQKKSVRPKFFISNEERISVSIDVLFDKDDGSILSIFAVEDEVDSKKLTELLGLKRLKFVFTRPNYDKINRYRTRCSEYNNETKSMMVNHLRMRDFFIIYHLKDWNIEDENGNVIKLEFDPNGALSDDSLNSVYNLHPSILDAVLNNYEKLLLLS